MAVEGSDAGPQRVERWLGSLAERVGLIWLAVGLAGVAGMALTQTSLLLSQVDPGGGQSYGAGVFSGFRMGGLIELEDAFYLWCYGTSAPPGPVACASGPQLWLYSHLLIDSILFAPALYFLLLWSLYKVQSSRAGAAVVLVAFVADLLENILIFLSFPQPKPGTANVAIVASDIKWIALGLAVALFVIQGCRTVFDGGNAHPVRLLRWPVATVALFLVIAGLPMGGPLDQVPDVIRAQLDKPSVYVVSILCLLVLAGTVVHAGQRSTIAVLTANEGADEEPKISGWQASGLVLLVGLGLALISFLIGWRTGSSLGDGFAVAWVPLVATLVTGGGLIVIGQLYRVTFGRPELAPTTDAGAGSSTDLLTTATDTESRTALPAAAADVSGPRSSPAGAESLSAWIGALSLDPPTWFDRTCS